MTRSSGALGFSSAAADKWASARNLGGVTPVWRTDAAFGDTVRDLSQGTVLQRAVVTDSFGQTYPVVQPVTQTVAAANATALVQCDMAVLDLWYGQSNAGYGGVGNASLETTKLFPHHAVSFTAGRSSSNPAATAPSSLVDFFAAQNSSSAVPMGCVTSVFASRLLDMREGRNRLFVGRADWQGAQPLETFEKGTQVYANALISVQGARDSLRKYGIGLKVVVNFVQGENRATALEQYPAKLAGLIATMRADIRALTGAEPAFVFWQTNSGDTSTGSFSEPTAKYHRQVAEQFMGSSAVMAGPMYQLPISDDIHCNEIGRLMQGELLALIKQQIERTGTFRPLMPAAASRSGAVVTLDLALPTGGKPVTLDSDWIGAIAAGTANAGFTFTDDSGAPPAIASVAVSGPAQIKVTLAAVPTGGNQKLRYGLDALDLTDDGFASCRGLVYSSSGVSSPFHERGRAVPADIRHYLIRCEVPVA